MKKIRVSSSSRESRLPLFFWIKIKERKRDFEEKLRIKRKGKIRDILSKRKKHG